ncbi:retrovirus-related pol polyprotein from transposon TNT 1-94 [Tanacetum coccineum]
MRITPTGLTEGERGFEQTKECYLTEVIPFFKTLKDHFEGIQKALTKEIKEMKEIFEELEAEVDQNVVNRKHDEIERKNLLIANDNLIADCLSKEVFYIATNSELTVSRFTEMHDAHTVVQARCLELEAELSKLCDKVQKDDHTELVKRFSNLEVYAIDVIEQFPLTIGTIGKFLIIQELLEYVIGTCPKDFNKQDKKHASTPLTRKKQVTFEDQCVTSNNNAHKHVEKLNIQKTNVPVIPSTGVNSCTDASGSQPRSNTKKNRISPAKSVNKKKVEEHPRTNKSSLKTTNRVDSSISSKRTVINSNSYSVCQTCNKCLISANHDLCVVNYLHSVNASPSVKNVMRKVKQVWKPKQVKQVWKATGKVLTSVGYQWRPTGRIFTLGEQCPLTRLTKSKVVPAKQTENVSTSKSLTRYQRRNQQYQAVLVSLPTSHENQAIASSMQSEHCRTVDPLKHSCYVRDTDGVELIKGSRGSNLYIISVEDMLKSSSICLLPKASKNKSWLWHRRLNHLNFGTINDLARKDLVRGLPRLEFEKDHLCSACQLGKSKKHTHTHKTENTNLEVLNTLHMDLCGPMRVQTINGKKYILVIVDDYSRFTWVKFLRSKDETPEFVIKFLKQIQSVGIFHQKSVPRTPQQNDVVERRNRTLVEAARTMLIFSKAPIFLWAEVVATAETNKKNSLFTQRDGSRNCKPMQLAKLPILKQGEYEMWRLRIEQYFQVQDYALWDVIENGNSFKPTTRTTTNADGTSTSMILGPVTTEEKAQKKNDVKARSMLLMALPNEQQLTFNQYKDAKTLFEAIQTRFGGNDATRKTQKTLLKQMLQEIVSQLAILGENISQEDLNLKFLRSLPSEWNTHVVNMAFVSSPSSTNEVNTANVQVSTANSPVSTADSPDSTANLSDATVYAFLANQPNGSQLVHEDLEQIHEDDLEEMDLKWQLALLSMRARRYFQRTGKKITINGSDTAGYDKSKVECFNCHKMGHFARECRGPRNQDNRNRNQDSSRRTVNVEETSSKAMVAIDGAGFDWSFMADEEVPTNMALMAFSDSEAHCNYHQREGMVNENNFTRVNYNYSAKKAHPNSHRNMTPKAVLMKTGLKPLNTARPVNTVHPKTTVYKARPMSCFSKLAQSIVKRPYQSRTTLTNKNFNQKINTAKEKVYTAKPKAVNTARPTSAVVNAVKANQVNAVKASACWVWRPTKLNSASITFKRQNYIDARGRSKFIHKRKIKDMLIVDALDT